MARNLSAAAKRAIFQQVTDEVFAVLLTIDHADLSDPIRVTSDARNMVSRGETFIAYPFFVSMPNEEDDQIPQVKLRIDNVSRAIVEAVRTIDSAPQVMMEIVLASAPDTLEAGPFNFTMKNVSYDALVVEGELSFEDILNAKFPEGTFNPGDWPGLFGTQPD